MVRSTNSKPLPLKPAAHEQGSFALDGAERDRLLDRLAQGARNAELSGEFGLTPKQVQGVRMGCAREIARRRERLSEPVPAQIAMPEASIEEVVRFLRQQDDVVVPQENGTFLVNGRFQMSLSELAVRANRIQSPASQASIRVKRHASTAKPSFCCKWVPAALGSAQRTRARWKWVPSAGCG